MANYVHKHIPNFLGGLHLEKPATYLSPDEATVVDNFWFYQNVLQMRSGYEKLGTTTFASGASGAILPLSNITGENVSVISNYPVMKFHTFTTDADVNYLCAFTPDTARYYLDGSRLWREFVNAKLGGDADNRFDVVTMNNRMIFTNGTDHIQAWTGAACVNLSGASGNYKSNQLAVLKDHLLLINTTEGGTAFPQRVRSSNVGAPGVYTAANYWDLMDSAEKIVAADNLGPTVVVYKPHSIVIGEHVGGKSLFAWTTVETKVGCSAPDTLVTITGKQYFLGQENVYEYSLGGGSKAIGDAVIADAIQGLNREKVGRSWAMYDLRLQEYQLYLPLYGADYPNVQFCYGLTTGKWRRVWSGATRSDTDKTPMTAGALYDTKTSALTWADMSRLGIAWDEIGDTRWDDQALGQKPATVLMGNESGYVYIDNYTTRQDDGVTILSEYATGDFWDKDYIANVTRWHGFYFEGRGDEIELSYSTDHGTTWKGAKTFTLSDDFSKQSYWFDVAARTMRIRFRNSSDSSVPITLRWGDLILISRSEHPATENDEA